MPPWYALRRPSIAIKLIGATIAIFLAAVSLMTLLSYDRYTRDFQQQSNERTKQILDQLSLNLDNYVDDLFRLSLSPYNNLQVLQLLDLPEPDTEYGQLQKERQIEDFLNQMIVTPRLDILQVYIITGDHVYLNGRAVNVEPLEPDFREQDWYVQALGTQTPIFLAAPKTIRSNPGVRIFSVVKQLRSLKDTTKPLAVIRVDANYSGIANIADKVDLGSGGGIVIADGNENVIYSSLKDVDPVKLYQTARERSASQFHLKENGRRYLAATSEIARADWTVISLNAVDELNRSAIVTRNFTILIAALGSLFACLILFFLIRAFLRPLLRMVSVMKQVKLGHLSVRVPELRSGDEIAYIGHSFNSMIGRIEEMMEENTRLTKEVFEKSYLQKEAQIHALVSQIRPHFIYNTLHTIGALIQVGRTEEATDNLEKLSLVLRGYASIDQAIPLRKELELLEAYLGIQKSRFGDRLAYRIDIDGSLGERLIPAILLQPIVENSVIHGCEPRRETTTIRISARTDGKTLALLVEDDGGGIPDDKLQALLRKIKSGPQTTLEGPEKWELRRGIGLVNVHTRLRMQYGEPYGLEIASSPGRGTTVRAALPYGEE
ncbi:cache domain-containing sensor histidine kinase [Cohnella fermenti]|uniref:histidine kinase n=1 Tax=Cohnella fermenti TaxID=2565925 RepID=A0A4S4C6B4_9BACL|nr:sensor histidine kinase [Cohnella fermenti]THF83429.1 sensor histidine kinase [Cohnella fermenti]